MFCNRRLCELCWECSTTLRTLFSNGMCHRLTARLSESTACRSPKRELCASAGEMPQRCRMKVCAKLLSSPYLFSLSVRIDIRRICEIRVQKNAQFGLKTPFFLQKSFVNSRKSRTFAPEFKTWYLGRVARHRSAKPATAVRFRQIPQKLSHIWRAFLCL